MAGRRVQYQIVGRCMNGTSVTGYVMQSIETGKSGKFTREQTALLVGRGQVTNCDATIYQDKVIFKGIGVSLDSLPIIRDGSVQNTDRIGHVRRDTTPEQAVNQYMLAGVITNGRNTVGYVIRNAGGQQKKIQREDCLKLAQANRLGNARIQNYNGRIILRGVGVNLNELPVTKMDESEQNSQSNQQASRTGTKSGKKVYLLGTSEVVSSIKNNTSTLHLNKSDIIYRFQERLRQQIKSIEGYSIAKQAFLPADRDSVGILWLVKYVDPSNVTYYSGVKLLIKQEQGGYRVVMFNHAGKAVEEPECQGELQKLQGMPIDNRWEGDSGFDDTAAIVRQALYSYFLGAIKDPRAIEK